MADKGSPGKKGGGSPYHVVMEVSDVRKSERVATVSVRVKKIGHKKTSDDDENPAEGIPVIFEYKTPGDKDFSTKPSVPDTLNPDANFITDFDGNWSHLVYLNQSQNKHVFQVTVIPEDAKPITVKKTYDFEDQWRPTQAPKFIAVSNPLGDGQTRIKMDLMNPETKVGVAGKIEISPTSEFKLHLNNENTTRIETIKRGESFLIDIGETGRSCIFEYNGEATCRIDVTIPGFPNEKFEIRLTGGPETPITISRHPTAWEILYNGYR